MKKIISIISSLSILLVLAGCAKTENSSKSSELLSDPFEAVSSSGSQDDFQKIDAAWDKLLERKTNAVFEINNSQRDIVYEGEPVRIPITINVDEENTINVTDGVFLFINGLVQEISTDGVNYDYIAKFSGLEPGKEYKEEIWLKPSILPEDKGKDTLEVSFTKCSDMDFSPQDTMLLIFFNSHQFPLYRVVLDMAVNKEITEVVDKGFETNVTEKLKTTDLDKDSRIMPNKLDENGMGVDAGKHFLNEDGTLSGTYRVIDSNNTVHRISFSVNDRIVTFNGGKTFCDVTAKNGYEYSFDFKLDENPKPMDYIYVFDFDNANNIPSLHTGEPHIIVAHDFVNPLKDPNVGTPEQSTGEDNESVPSTNKVSIKGLSSWSFLGRTNKDGKTFSMFIIGDKICVVDIETGDVLSELNCLDYSDNSSTEGEAVKEMYWKKLQPMPDGFVVYSTTAREGFDLKREFYIFDYDCKLLEVIDCTENPYVENICQIDGKPMFICEEFSENGNKLILVDPETNASTEILNMNTSFTEKTYVAQYGDLWFGRILNGDNESKYIIYTIAIDLREKKAYTFETEYPGNYNCEKILMGGNTVLWQPSMRAKTGELVMFDTEKRDFWTIYTQTPDESHNATLSPDGRIIYTVYSTEKTVGIATVADESFLRSYDSKTGELLAEQQLPDTFNGGKIICSDDGVLVSQSNGKCTFISLK